MSFSTHLIITIVQRTRLTVAFCLAPHVLFQLPLSLWPIAYEGDTHTPMDARGKVIGLPRQRRFLPGLITPMHDISARLCAWVRAHSNPTNGRGEQASFRVEATGFGSLGLTPRSRLRPIHSNTSVEARCQLKLRLCQSELVVSGRLGDLLFLTISSLNTIFTP